MLNLHDHVTIMTKQGDLVSGVIRGRVFLSPIKYEIKPDDGGELVQAYEHQVVREVI
jgi:hypothetical protein